MKKVVLSALLLAAASALSAAHAQTFPPLSNHYYNCDYTNPTMHEKDPGLSIFNVSSTSMGSRGSSSSRPTYGGVIWDNRKVTFAKPADRIRINPAPVMRRSSGPIGNSPSIRTAPSAEPGSSRARWTSASSTARTAAPATAARALQLGAAPPGRPLPLPGIPAPPPRLETLESNPFWEGPRRLPRLFRTIEWTRCRRPEWRSSS